jgi:organic radical activating enzyme
MIYSISEIFNTLSGEVPTVGQQSTFVRTFGCPVGCKWCDTLHTVPWDGVSFKKGYDSYPDGDPLSKEEIRGYIASAYDKTGMSYYYYNDDKSEINFKVKDNKITTKIIKYLKSWNMKPLYPDLYKLVILRGNKFEIQRFFDLVRPRDISKYGENIVRWVPKNLTEDEIALECKRKLVVITGGSPTMQNLDALIGRLHDRGHVTQLETEGSYALHEKIPDIVVCSPKANIHYKVHPKLIPHVTCFKYVVDDDFKEEIVIDNGTPIYLMPEGHPPSEINTKRVLEILSRRTTWHFGPRIHTQINVQ